MKMKDSADLWTAPSTAGGLPKLVKAPGGSCPCLHGGLAQTPAWELGDSVR